MFECARRGFSAVLSPPQPGPLTYFQVFPFGLFGIVVIVGALPEMLLHHLFLHGIWPYALDIAAVGSGVWLLDVYGSMIARPHVIDESAITVNFGSLRSQVILFSQIDDVGLDPRGRVRVRLLDGKRLKIQSDRPQELRDSLFAVMLRERSA